MRQQQNLAARHARPAVLGFGFAFRNSLRGLRHAVRFERAVRQEILAIVVGIPTAMTISSQPWTRTALIGVLLLVVAVELVNTAVEKLCDHVTPARHLEIGMVKDIGSAAVLCALCFAALVWATAVPETLS